MTGPLASMRVVEIAGKGPGPFAAMLLADLGADVIRVDQPTSGGNLDPTRILLNRGRSSIIVDLKAPGGVDTIFRLVDQADALIEGYRPGVMERLGLGPDVCLGRNPALVYGRMTGWGQDGPLAHYAGHDINYIAMAGALDNFRRENTKPLPPLNLVGDFGGGGMLMAFGVVSGVLNARQTGQGQVVDAAMVDGTALLMTMLLSLVAQGQWREPPGTNALDTGAHFYEVYETADGKYVAVGAIEPKFYAALLEGLGISDDETLPAQHDRASWPEMKERLAETFRLKTRDEWSAIFEGVDACVSPVLSLAEAADHPHNAGRGTFIERDGVIQPGPAPRFSGTPAQLGAPPSKPGVATVEALSAWGFTPEEITKLRTWNSEL
jgi:alpha-methylacyl-CoA racemase